MVTAFFRRYWGEIGVALFLFLIFQGHREPALSGGSWEWWLQKHFLFSQFSAHLVVYVVRKTGHFAGYGLLALCLCRVLAKYRPRLPPARLFWLSWSGTTITAVTDEIFQSFSPYRSGNWYDIVLDLLGVTFFLLVLWKRTE